MYGTPNETLTDHSPRRSVARSVPRTLGGVTPPSPTAISDAGDPERDLNRLYTRTRSSSRIHFGRRMIPLPRRCPALTSKDLVRLAVTAAGVVWWCLSGSAVRAQNADGQFTSAPVFSENGFALAVFTGGTAAQLETATAAAGRRAPG